MVYLIVVIMRMVWCRGVVGSSTRMGRSIRVGSGGGSTRVMASSSIGRRTRTTLSG